MFGSFRLMVGLRGFEPPTSFLSGKHSYQTELQPIVLLFHVRILHVQRRVVKFGRAEGNRTPYARDISLAALTNELLPLAQLSGSRPERLR